jgi:ubiquinone/menaquinone biosynthesis C-methylase UbiE
VNFDGVARWYAVMERMVYGNTLQQARNVLFDELGTPRSALLIGDGDGRFSAEFVRRFPGAEVDIVEPSREMARIARERSRSTQIRWHCIPVQEFQPKAAVWDVVVTQFVLDVLTEAEVEELVRKLAPATRLWLVAEFQPGVHDWLLRVMYLFFRLTAELNVNRLPDYGRLMEHAGLRRLHRRVFWRGFIAAELYCSRSISLVT